MKVCAAILCGAALLYFICARHHDHVVITNVGTISANISNDEESLVVKKIGPSPEVLRRNYSVEAVYLGNDVLYMFDPGDTSIGYEPFVQTFLTILNKDCSQLISGGMQSYGSDVSSVVSNGKELLIVKCVAAKIPLLWLIGRDASGSFTDFGTLGGEMSMTRRTLNFQVVGHEIVVFGMTGESMISNALRNHLDEMGLLIRFEE